MKLKFVLLSTACLSYFLVPASSINLLAAAAAAKGVVIDGITGAISGPSVVIQAKPPQVILEHKPVTLVPVATVPSYGITDKVAKLWGGISDSITSKINAVGDFFRGPPNVVLVKPTKKPVVLEVAVGLPHYRVPLPAPMYPYRVPLPCGNQICTY